MTLLPPGTILQHMYLRERLRKLSPGRFIEIGPGAGDITSLLLANGWVGTCYDFNMETVNGLINRFNDEVRNGDLAVVNDDFLAASISENTRVDLVISCMVMEHLDESAQQQFMCVAEKALTAVGRMIALVPSAPTHWGIEDDIAGHHRRYTRDTVATMLSASNWELKHLSGLTYPLSNALLPFSNYLVKRSESDKQGLSMMEKTKLSGNRKVFFKTNFPIAAKLVLNSVVLWPFHVLQKVFSNSATALVLYFEAIPLKK